MDSYRNFVNTFTPEQVSEMFGRIYQEVLSGAVDALPSIEEFVQNYRDKSLDDADAARRMLKNQVLKCATSGFVTGFGGALTLPVMVPANLVSVLYLQMRMIACTAYLAGYDIRSDQVQTLVYACLVGVSLGGVMKKAGIEFGEKVTSCVIKKIPGPTLKIINQKMGFRFITRGGSTGIINLGRMVPFVGAAVSGGFDLVQTKIIAARAYRWFFEGDFNVNVKKIPRQRGAKYSVQNV